MLMKKSQIIDAPASQRLALCPFRGTGGWKGGLPVETEKASSQRDASKMRRVPTVRCIIIQVRACPGVRQRVPGAGRRARR